MEDIVIIGGGIGGMTAAIALRQRGLAATVYEAAAELRPVGAGILVPPNAMQVYGRLGVADAVQQAGFVPRAAEILDARDGLLQRSDSVGLAGSYGFPTVAIHRARLHGVLAAALGPAAIRLGKACTAIVDEPGGALVRFADGDAVRARVVIGADGLRSVVRQHLFPDAALRYSGQSSYRAVVPFALPEEIADVGWEVWGAGCRFGFSSVAPGEVYWYATVDAAPGTERDRRPYKERLAELFADFPAPIAALIAATPETSMLNTDIYDLRPLARWHRGRVVLLGDAAHATTPNLGQGGAQAVEDAAVLAECLATHREPEEAFASYERRRRAKASMVVARSWSIGKLAHVRNPVARAARNVVMRSIPPAMVARQFDTIFRLDDAPAQAGQPVG